MWCEISKSLKDDEKKIYECKSFLAAKIINYWYKFRTCMCWSDRHHGGDHPFRNNPIWKIFPIEEIKEFKEPITYRE